MTTQNPSPSPPGQVHQDHLPCFRITSPKTPGAPTTSPASRASVHLLIQKNLWDGFGKGIPDQVPREAAPLLLPCPPTDCCPFSQEGSRSFLGRGISRTNHWDSFLSCLRKPGSGHPFGSSFLGQDPEPPCGTTRSLPVSSGRSSRQTQQLWRGHRPAGFQRGTAHPASASPPGPGGGLSLTGRVAGDSHTWFTEGTAGAGVWDAYLIAVPSLATWSPRGTLAQDRT